MARTIELGIFARVFPPGPPDRVAGLIREAGYEATQLNLSAIGRPTLDPDLTDEQAGAIAADFHDAGVRIWGLSGTFNAIHPDAAVRETGIRGCRANILRAATMGVEVVTLCTGTCDPGHMWRGHPDNSSPGAWSDLRASLDRLIPVAARAGVRLGIEPEAGNVIRDADSAARLFGELGVDARHLAIVLDPANLLTVETLPQQEHILSHAFGALGGWTIGLHAKDVVVSGYAAPGVGGMDYGLVMRLHAGLPRAVPVIAQSLAAEDAPRVAAFLAAQAASVRAG